MLKLSARILAIAALGFALAAPRPSHAASAYNHGGPTNWSHAYVLTPLEHKRLRTYGLKDMEVFMIANAATESGRDVDEIVQLYLCHYYTELQAVKYLNRTPLSLTKLRPEWTTPEWQEAVKRGDYTWFPPQPATGGDAAKAVKAKVRREEKEAAR
jgi:hypothetical protein